MTIFTSGLVRSKSDVMFFGLFFGRITARLFLVKILVIN